MQTESSIAGTDRLSAAVKLLALVAGGGLCLLVALLASQNRQLEATLAEVSLRVALGGLQEGDVIPPLELVDLDGARETKEWSGNRSRLLFFFTTTCSACEQNLDRWREAHSRYSNEFEIIAIGLDTFAAVRAYAQEQNLPFEVRVAEDQYLAKSLGIVGVPETLVVTAEGTVQQVYVGLLPEGWEV